MPIKIITDSAADLPKEIIEQYDIDVIPLYVYHEDEEFLDGQTLHPDELYSGMREGKIYKTGQVPPETFKRSLLNMLRKIRLVFM
ncbi:MAG TPA: DegV family protein [Defluviitaleaceae bacterium]|nr:DegV family protein [Defluviitaleaceae bacterium]